MSESIAHSSPPPRGGACDTIPEDEEAGPQVDEEEMRANVMSVLLKFCFSRLGVIGP